MPIFIAQLPFFAGCILAPMDLSFSSRRSTFMVVPVFVIGRPGSGKTTVVRNILGLAEQADIPTLRMKDYHILYDMFKNEQSSVAEITSPKFRPTEYEGFDVLDWSVFDDALRALEARVQDATKINPEEVKLVTIEF